MTTKKANKPKPLSKKELQDFMLNAFNPELPITVRIYRDREQVMYQQLDDSGAVIAGGDLPYLQNYLNNL